jgi:hypothetical protein
MAIASLGWYAALAIRIGTPDGQELAGRTATFVYVPASLIAGLALVHLVNSGFRRGWEALAVTVSVVAMLMLLFDGLANGWPPYWERMPGSHQVAGFERSVGPEEVATAQWTLSALGPSNRFASDIGIYPLLIGYGDQDPLQDVGSLYTTPTYSSSEHRFALAEQVRYILVDRRLSEALPASGAYFPGDAFAGNRPLPMVDLAKFDHVRYVARVYDSGNIVIYDLQRSWYAP